MTQPRTLHMLSRWTTAMLHPKTAQIYRGKKKKMRLPRTNAKVHAHKSHTTTVPNIISTGNKYKFHRFSCSTRKNFPKLLSLLRKQIGTNITFFIFISVH